MSLRHDLISLSLSLYFFFSSGVPVSRWTIASIAIILFSVCVLALIMVFREIARRRVNDKQQVRLIENPSFGVLMPNDGCCEDENETDTTQELNH